MTYLEACVDLANHFKADNEMYDNAIRYAKTLNDTYHLAVESVNAKVFTESGTNEDLMILLEAAAEDSAEKVSDGLERVAQAATKFALNIWQKTQTQMKSEEYQKMLRDVKMIKKADKKWFKEPIEFNDYSDGIKSTGMIMKSVKTALDRVSVNEYNLKEWRKALNSSEVDKKPKKSTAPISAVLKRLTTAEAKLYAYTMDAKQMEKKAIAIQRKVAKQIATNSEVSSGVTEGWTVFNRAFQAQIMMSWKEYVSMVAAINGAVRRGRGSIGLDSKGKESKNA